MALPSDWQFWVLVSGIIFNAGVTWTMVRQLRKDINGTVKDLRNVAEGLNKHVAESVGIRTKVNTLWERFMSGVERS